MQSEEWGAHGHLSPLFQRGWQVRAFCWFSAHSVPDFSPRTKTAGQVILTQPAGPGLEPPSTAASKHVFSQTYRWHLKEDGQG